MARGTVQRYKDGWSIRYDAGLDEETGKRRQPFESGFATRQLAETRLAQCLHEVAKGTYVKPSIQTFGDFARYWLTTIMPGTVRETSRATYEDTVEHHLIPAFDRLSLQSLKQGHVKRLYQDCVAKGLHPQTIRTIHARLAQIMRCALDEQLIAVNIVEKIAAPHVERREMRVWSAAELAAFLQLSRDHRLWPLWHVYAMTGMRRGEAIGLRWQDVDWARNQLHVRQQVVRDHDRLVFGPPKTAASRRSIVVGVGTMEVLKAHRKRQTEARLADEHPWEDNDLVFAREPEHYHRYGLGTPWGPDLIGKYFVQEVVRLGMPRIRLHDLRHTHATILLAEDGNIKTIAARLGHDPAVLLRTYAHVMPEGEIRAVARFEAALARPQETVNEAAL